MGVLPRSRGHVVGQISSQTRRLSWSRAELSPGYRGADAGNKFAEEGGCCPTPVRAAPSDQLQDIASASIPNMSLPLITLPHFSTPSLAMSVLSDILSRLSHSNPVVRKKTIVCLYRLALVYPEALKLAWPKIKDRLMDDEEDSSVTSAAINVVCELGWRRPHDFLPLAPRFFELLVDSGNNWMAIKIIKLVGSLGYL